MIGYLLFADLVDAAERHTFDPTVFRQSFCEPNRELWNQKNRWKIIWSRTLAAFDQVEWFGRMAFESIPRNLITDNIIHILGVFGRNFWSGGTLFGCSVSVVTRDVRFSLAHILRSSLIERIENEYVCLDTFALRSRSLALKALVVVPKTFPASTSTMYRASSYYRNIWATEMSFFDEEVFSIHF